MYQKLTEISGNEWDITFKGYKATVDEPVSLFYKELMEYYPKSKVILTVRDNSEKWYNSYYKLMKAAFAVNRMWFVNLIWKEWRMSRILSCHMIGKLKFGDDYEYKMFNDPQFCQKVYEEWNESVIKYVPKDRLLVFNVKQGWDPLCEFLDIKDIPNKPFPHLNESKTIEFGTDL